MKQLTPKKINVYSVYLISSGAKPHQDEEEVRRRSHVGLFDTDISPEDIKEALENNPDLLGGHLGSRAYLGDSAFVEIHQKQIDEGVVFESIDECLHYLRNGLTYQHICDGYRTETATVIKGKHDVEI